MTEFAAPLVSCEVDLRDFSFMPLDVLRLRDSELSATLNAEAFRCSVLSWCVAWHQLPAASLPDDDLILSRLLGFGRDIKGWKKVRAAGGLRGWVRCSDGRLYHPVVAEKAREAWDAKLAQRARTEAARRAREEKRQRELQEMLQMQNKSVTENVTESKGQGQGQGQGYVNPSDADASSSAINAQFSKFWETWPRSSRKVDKAKCLKIWGREKLDAHADTVIAHVEAMKRSKQWQDGYEPAPLKYLTGKRWQDEVLSESYDDREISVISSYNAILAPNGWPEATIDIFSLERARAIREFLMFGKKPDWISAYLEWMKVNIPARPGYGFDWVIRQDTYLRAREGNFAVLKA